MDFKTGGQSFGPISATESGAPSKASSGNGDDEPLAVGDMDGRAVWLRVLKAVEVLLERGPPRDGEVVH